MEKKLVFTPIDYTNDLIGLDRFDTESYEEFVSRVGSLYKYRPGADYLGNVWASLHELALPMVPFVDLYTTIPSSTMYINSTELVLSNDVETISVEFFTTGPTGDIELVSDFASFFTLINNSTTFSYIDKAQALDDLESPSISTSIYPSITLRPVNLLHLRNELHYQTVLDPDMWYYRLPVSGLVPSNVSVENEYVDLIEVDAPSGVIHPYNYYINYETGEFYSYGWDSSPGQDLFLDQMYFKAITIRYNQWPNRLYLTPIQFLNWKDDGMNEILYNVYGQTDQLDRVPFPITEDIISELRNANASY